MRPSRSRLILYTLLGGMGLFLTCSLAGVFALLHGRYTHPDSRPLIIEKGMTPSQVLRLLHQQGVVHHPRLLQLYLRLTGKGAEIQAGEYRFDSPTSAYLVLKKLWLGDVLLHDITIPEGFTAAETAERFVSNGFGSLPNFEQAFQRVDLLRGITEDATSLEGYLAPDTYRLSRGTEPAEIVRLMVGRFRERLPPNFSAHASQHGLTLHEAVTLASLIEKETAQGDERPLVASVFHNRLDQGMLLQCDPTVIFALKQSGHFRGKLTKRDLAFDSPYNTYLYHGLPPGPICNPGHASLASAAAPATTRLLYFVARPDGSHQFSTTLADHNRAVQKYQILSSR